MRTILGIPIIAMVLGCGSTAATEGPGPKRPREPDAALEAATPVSIHDRESYEPWLAERVSNAREGRSERVRVPLIRRGPFACDCPIWGIAPGPFQGDYTWLHVVDLTGAGLPDPEDGWAGWADGRFTGATETFVSKDDGAKSELPVFEVFYARERSLDDEPVVRHARE